MVYSSGFEGANNQGEAYKPSMSLDFGTVKHMKHARQTNNCLFQVAPTVTVYKADQEEFATREQKKAIPKAIVRSSVTRKVLVPAEKKVIVGLEVGNLQSHYNLLTYGPANFNAFAAKFTMQENLARGGWGLPLCAFDVATECTDTKCELPVNCINEGMLEDEFFDDCCRHCVVARDRKTTDSDFGGVENLFDLSASGGDASMCGDDAFQVHCLYLLSALPMFCVDAVRDTTKNSW